MQGMINDLKSKVEIDKVKNAAWEYLKDAIENKEDDDTFNQTAYSVKLTDTHNLVVWCDVDYDFSPDGERCFITSIRDNKYDDLFGNDIGIELITKTDTKEDLFNSIEDVIKLLADRLK